MIVSLDYLTGLLQATILPPISVELPSSGEIVDVLTLGRCERGWEGSIPATFASVPNKPVLEFEEQPSWAEFILLRLLESDGWKGAWAKNWGGRDFWSEPLKSVPLPPSAFAVYQKLAPALNGAGCWDILVEKDAEVLFVESKQRGKDRLKPTQRAWLERALEQGLSLSSFLIVEWSRR